MSAVPNPRPDSRLDPRPDPRPDPRRWCTLAALVASTLVIGFDTTILNIALPTITSLAAAALVATLLPRTVPADQGAMVQETADARQ
ncbi:MULTISPECIES: hypothetical protein [Streptomyces violaceusniger group]|uniref:MFS transporter n=2 Tax=Streptomyces rhizosphaericus TaxID=114699 RepID=A0ABN1SE42_9ACTN|nr:MULTISPECIES: hypothetical protein [Streptomyces violaceusniger group]